MRLSRPIFLTIILSPFLVPAPALSGACDSDLTCQFLLCRSPASGAPAELWGDLRPVDAGQLPAIRDTTDFDEFGPTGYTSSEPLWMALDVEGNYLFAGIHLGLETWQRTSGGAGLSRLDVVDGSAFAFWNNPVQAHEFFPVRDIDASTGAGGGGGTPVVALSLVNNIGLSVLNFDDPANPVAVYGDKNKQGHQVYVTDIDDRTYAFMASGGTGLLAYDLTAVGDNASACVDSSPGQASCGAYIGRLGSTANFSYVDGVGDFVVASGGGLSFGLEIWDVSTPSNPQLVLDHGGDFVHGVALWQDGGSYYLGTRVTSITPPTGLFGRIYDVSCIATDSCISLGSALWSSVLPGAVGTFYTTYSESSGTGYLYFGSTSRCDQTLQAEWLFDVSNPSSPNDVTPPPALVNGVLTGYWGSYYRRNPTGYNQVAARMGKFSGNYFYRAAFSILDIHELSAPQAPTVGVVSASPNPALQCQDVTFDLQSATGNPPPTLSWELRDGGGSLVTTAGNVDPFVWSVPSTAPVDDYTATVTATNSLGSAMASSPAVAVTALPPLSFDGPPTHDAFTGPTVQFHISSEGATEWNWDFGDGSTSGWVSDPVEGPNPVHTYGAIGDYDVTVSIRNCVAGPVESTALEVNIVNTVPLAIDAFEGDVCSAFGCFVEAGESIDFTTSVTGSPTLYEYDWNGDSVYEQASASPILEHTYSATGSVLPRVRASRPGESVTLAHTPGSITVTTSTGSLPAAPSGLGAAAVSSSEVQLTWSDNSAGETGFEVEVTREGLFIEVVAVAANSTSTLIGGLDSDTAYSFRVRAVSTDGRSDWDGPAAVTTPVDGLLVFTDGFESGDTTAWDATVP